MSNDLQLYELLAHRPHPAEDTKELARSFLARWKPTDVALGRLLEYFHEERTRRTNAVRELEDMRELHDDRADAMPENDPVYAHPECVWNYCPTEQDCRAAGGCLNKRT